MKTLRILCCVVAVVAANIGWSAPKGSLIEFKGGETPEQIQEAYTQALQGLLPDLSKDNSDALRKFEATLHNAARPGAEQERLACCNAIATALEGEASPTAKDWMLKLVAFAGRAEVVPAVAKLLNGPDLQLREMARAALQHNPTREADLAIQNALLKVWREDKEPDWQVALLLAMAARQEIANLDGIFALSQSKHANVQQAALAALGLRAKLQAVQPKSGVWNSMPEKARDLGAEAYVKTAEYLLQHGKAGDAARMYEEVYTAKLGKPIRLAALAGLLRSTGDEAGKKILELLGGEDQDARAIAIGVIPDLGNGPLKALAVGMGKLPADSQVLVLGTLAERGEKSALPMALEFARSKDEKSQQAGLSAMARLGDASSVPMLAEAMQAGGSAAGIAKDSLAKLSGEGVDARILEAMQAQTDAGRRAAMIEVIEGRSAATAVPLLLEEAVKDNAGVRRAAMRALGKLAVPKDVPAMVKGLLKAAPGSEREEAEKAIANVCARTTEPGQQAEAVLSLYKAGSPADRTALLPVLGRLGGTKVFEVVKTALASSDAETYQAAVDAISNWPDSDETVETELLNLAQKTEKSQDRAAAVRAYIRVISQPSGIPDKARLAKFQKATELAERDQEKALVLEKIADIKRIETLRFVVPFMDKPSLAEKACTATLDLARDRNLRGQNKAEFEQALSKVVATSKDKGSLERANRYRQEKLQ